MESIKGVILMNTCHTYLSKREDQINMFLSRKNILGWKCIILLGDVNLDKDYEYDKDKHILKIKCEDSYLHILKKRALAFKYLMEIFDIEEGILSCVDRLQFNYDKLETFIKNPKHDYYGQAGKEHGMEKIFEYSPEQLKLNRKETWMYLYYLNHPSDFTNPYNNLTNISIDTIKSISVVPNVYGAGGTLYYLSKKCCKTIIKHMEDIEYNVLHFDIDSNSWPYSIEDIGISYILFKNKFKFYHKNIFSAGSNENINNFIAHSKALSWYFNQTQSH